MIQGIEAEIVQRRKVASALPRVRSVPAAVSSTGWSAHFTETTTIPFRRTRGTVAGNDILTVL
jgi:hypothetical protein